MRTLLEVKTEMMTLQEEIAAGGLKQTQVSRRKNRIEFLKMVARYLETCPDELYLGREIARIENKITAYYDLFDPTQFKDPTEPRKKYEKDMGIPELRKQLTTLRYINK